MKLSFISLILSAGLAISQVSASPLHVVVVSNDKPAVPQRFRLGYPVAAAKNMQDIPVYNSLSTASAEMSKQQPKRMGCLRNKAMRVTNWLRITVGLAPFDPNMYRNGSVVHQATTVNMVPYQQPSHHGHHHPHHGFKYHVKHRSQAFVDRLTIALMMLGPWEGRAVAFVLGCGLGALLRMVWVLAIITARAVRGRSQEDDDDLVDVVIFEEEEHLLPPPQYEQNEAPRDVKEKVEN